MLQLPQCSTVHWAGPLPLAACSALAGRDKVLSIPLASDKCSGAENQKRKKNELMMMRFSWEKKEIKLEKSMSTVRANCTRLPKKIVCLTPNLL